LVCVDTAVSTGTQGPAIPKRQGKGCCPAHLSSSSWSSQPLPELPVLRVGGTDWLLLPLGLSQFSTGKPCAEGPGTSCV
jgi:hypothetical protein